MLEFFHKKTTSHQKLIWARFYHMGYPDLQWVNSETTSICHLLANDEINEAYVTKVTNKC